VDGNEGSRGQHRALHTLLAAIGQEGTKVCEVAELGPVDRGGAGWQRVTDLRDYDPDFACRYLNPRVFGDGALRPELEPNARHEQVCLISRLALEREGSVGGVMPG